MGGGGAIGTEPLPLDKMLHTPWYGPLPEVPIIKELHPSLHLHHSYAQPYCYTYIHAALQRYNTAFTSKYNWTGFSQLYYSWDFSRNKYFSTRSNIFHLNIFFNKKMIKSSNLIRKGTLIFPKIVLEII